MGGMMLGEREVGLQRRDGALGAALEMSSTRAPVGAVVSAYCGVFCVRTHTGWRVRRWVR